MNLEAAMSKTVEGLKAISVLIQRVWQRSVSTDAVIRFNKRERDPLPYETRGGRVVADEGEVIAWAQRN